MTTYTDVFGGANIYTSEIDYSAIALTANIALSWPEETSNNLNLATKIMDITPDASGREIELPAANKTGNGQTILFNNRGGFSFTVRNASGVQVVTVAPGTLWQIYITNNSTEGGVWQALQYGASTSIANASSLAGNGIVAVGTLLAQSVPITQFNGGYTAGAQDRARMFVWTGAAGTFGLPAPTDVGDNWFCYLRNSGSGSVVTDPTGTATIDGTSTLSFQPGESAIIATDGANYFTIGFGQSATFAFDYTSIDVSGSGNYTLSGTELNRIAYGFTGTLTGNRNIIVPATVQQYWVNNDTAGAFDFTVKTSLGSGVVVAAGARQILYCDGANVVKADTAGLSVPIQVSNGGTGATTAGAARINLGATALGDALFTAPSGPAAYAALGVAPAGVVIGGAF
jgi:hypothetical protein